MSNSYCLFILGNGRGRYLERTIASWEANLVDEPKYRFIFDDSGNKEYVAWIEKRFGDKYTVVPIGERPMGQAVAMNKIFETLSKLDIDYILELEEDWMLFRPLDVNQVMDALDSDPNILQMRIPRTIWYSDYHKLDLDAGSILYHHIESDGEYRQTDNGKNSWFEWRGEFYFWSHNPCVFSKSLLSEQYPGSNVKDHEMAFGKNLIHKYPESSVGFWAENPYDGYVTHIGIRDGKMHDSLSEHFGWQS
jgi:hypothetical protein